MDFGNWTTLNVCVLKEAGFSEEETNELFAYWAEELRLYKINLQIQSQAAVDRPGFYGWDILSYLNTLPLPKTCDRIIYLKGRKWSDIGFEAITLGIFLAGGLKLEVQGAVETETRTRGYIKGKYISTLQLLFTSPKSTLVHEGYHLLGCDHQFWMEACYIRLQKLKSAKGNFIENQGFFPGLDSEGNLIVERKLVDQYFLSDRKEAKN